jgi:uncharacterized protein (TIGR03435 family)
MGRFTAVMTTKQLIAWAYNPAWPFPLFLYDAQISGGPDWIRSEKFEIDAKVEGTLVESEEKVLPSADWQKQLRLMTRSMLADRFKLKVGHQTKELPVYALVQAKSGPKISQVRPMPRCAEVEAATQGSQQSAQCSSNPYYSFGGVFSGLRTLHADSAPFSGFAAVLDSLPELMERAIVDKTGLQGKFTFDLKWQTANLSAGGTSATDSVGPSIFAALQEQLGLRLESATAPVDVIVIEQIETPTEN